MAKRRSTRYIDARLKKIWDKADAHDREVHRKGAEGKKCDRCEYIANSGLEEYQLEAFKTYHDIYLCMECAVTLGVMW